MRREGRVGEGGQGGLSARPAPGLLPLRGMEASYGDREMRQR